MKTTLTILCLLLMSCDPQLQNPNVIKGGRKVRMDNGYTLTVSEVVLDGNVYYVTRVNGGYCLCPKLPPK